MPEPADRRFARCLEHILREEGGYADHPADPGGATNFGITRRTLAGWRGVEPWQRLAKAEVKALGRAEAAALYRARYWRRIGGDDLAAGIDLALFDFAVNSGPARAVQTLQIHLGLAADGTVGPKTRAALDRAEVKTLIDALCERRLGFLESLTNFAIFGRGWRARIARIRAAARAMAGETSTPQAKEKSIMNLFAGYRTYIVAGLMALTAVAKLLGIDIPAFEAAAPGTLLMEAMAFIFLRRGVSAAGRGV